MHNQKNDRQCKIQIYMTYKVQKERKLKPNFPVYVNISPRYFPALGGGSRLLIPPFFIYFLLPFFLHVISVWSQPGGSSGIQGHCRYVTSNWVYMEMTHPFLLAAVKRHRLQSGPVLVQF